MDQAPPNARVIRFAPFEVDLRSGEVRKNGVKRKLSGQPFQVLAILLERPGEVVTREDLQNRLWPDTFVDVDHSLNTAINKIREVLGDSTESPRFVETLPRRGYRFICQIDEPVVTTGPIEQTDAPIQFPRWRFIAASAFLATACLAFAYLFHFRQSHVDSAPIPPSTILFTSLPGAELAPDFSPNGSLIAFAWSGDSFSQWKGFDLFVKALGSETLLQLTHHPSEWLSPAWSPDGTELAFHRFAGEDTGIYTVPALGGPERKLRATHIQYYANAPISWSPDAKSIAFGDSTDEGDRIFLLSKSTLETSMIRHDPECVHEAQPTFSHSGKELAYLCVHSLVQVELRSLDFPDGQPRILATFHPLNGIAWSADDSKLVVSVQPLIYNFRHYFRLAETELGANTGCEMYEVPREGGQARRLDYAANGAWPAISAKGNKFAYSRDDGKAKVWRQDLLRPDAPATPLLTSTQNQGDAHFSPDGNRIVFESTRAGSSDIWISDADGANPARLSKLNGVAWCPRWSPDSKKVAFVLNQSEHSDIYVVDSSEGLPRKLLTNIQDIQTPNWSHDGKWIYFSARTTMDKGNIYRCPATGGDAEEIKGAEGRFLEESSDGTALYYGTRPLNTSVSLVSLNGAFPPTTIKGIPPVVGDGLWTVTPGGIYFVPDEKPTSLNYYDFATEKIRQVFQAKQHFSDGLSVSSDGRWLLYSLIEAENSDIVLVDNFQ